MQDTVCHPLMNEPAKNNLALMVSEGHREEGEGWASEYRLNLFIQQHFRGAL